MYTFHIYYPLCPPKIVLNKEMLWKMHAGSKKRTPWSSNLPPFHVLQRLGEQVSISSFADVMLSGRCQTQP